jgi:hypothetical protein
MNHALPNTASASFAPASEHEPGVEGAGIAHNFARLPAASSAKPAGNRVSMKPDLRTPLPLSSHHARPIPRIAPSLQIAATAQNRSLLRWLRAMELSAWQDADARSQAASPIAVARPRGRPFFQLNCL